MKGQYADRAPGATEGGERVLLWATVIKAVDASNHVVQCAGEVFNPSAQAMSAAEPTSAELKTAASKMEQWERKEVERLKAEEAKAKTDAAARDRKVAEAATLADLEAGGVMNRIKTAVVSALTSGSKGQEAGGWGAEEPARRKGLEAPPEAP